MILLFIRHATTNENDLGMQGIIGHDDVLNAKGKKQANKAREICAEFNPTAVYSSPFLRAKQTAEIIADGNLDVHVTKDLREFDVGDRAELTIEEAQELLREDREYMESEDKYTAKVPGGESWEDIHIRIERFLNRIFKSHADDDVIVCVTHNVVLKEIVGNIQKLPFEKRLKIMHKTGSVSAFEFVGEDVETIFVDKH